MRRGGVFVFVAAGLLVVGGLVLWLSRGESEGAESAAAVAPAAPGETAGERSSLPASRASNAAPESASLEELHPAVAAAPTDPIPAAYRAALGGLIGRVVEHTPGDKDTLRPVAGLAVELAGGRVSTFLPPRDALVDPSQLERQLILGSAVTDAEGRFKLEQIDPRTLGALILDPGGPRALLWPLEVTPTSGQTTDLGDMVLPAMATLFGTIVDERGAPVPGARVRATDLPMQEAFVSLADFRAGGGIVIAAESEGAGNHFFQPPPSLARLESRLPLPTTLTDATGKFELTGVPPGLVALIVDDGVHLPLARTGVATGAAGGRRDVGAVTIGDGLPLSVKVRTSDGKNVPAAQVFAGNQMPMVPVAIMKAPKQRGDDGSARFTGLAKGQGWVAARADDRHGFTVLSLPEVAAGEATITLPSPHSVTLSVVDAGNGAPVAGATFYGRAVKDNQTPDFLFPPITLAERTQGAGDGRYVVSELEPTEWEITTIVPGHPQQRLNVDLSAGDASAEVRLLRGLPAAVRVVAAGNGAPLEYALVSAYPEAPEGDAPEFKVFEGPASTARTDATGLARFTTLPPGSVRFSVNHPGFAITEGVSTLPSEAELRIELSTGGAIAGQVLDQGGPPAEPLAVMLMPHEAKGDAELPRMVLTDREGSFRFARVEPGSVDLEVRSRMEVGAGLSLFEAMMNSPLAETSATVNDGGETQVVLQVGGEMEGVETGFVSGQLTVNGAAASGWKIRTWGRIRRSVSTDEQGRFDLGRIAAGKVTLLVSGPTQNIGSGYTDQREIELKKDDHQFVSLELVTGAIAGRVVSAASNEPLAGVEVSAASDVEHGGWSRQPGAISAHDGTFTIEPVVAGRYHLRARQDGFAQTSSQPFDVTAFQTKSGLELRLPKALVVSGTITLEGTTEKPDWIYVGATGGDGGNGREGARVDPTKLSFSFERLGPGEWTFDVSTSLDTDFTPVKLTLTGDQKNLTLVFKPLPPDAPMAPDVTTTPFVYDVK